MWQNKLCFTLLVFVLEQLIPRSSLHDSGTLCVSGKLLRYTALNWPCEGERCVRAAALPWLAQLAPVSPLVPSDCGQYLMSTIHSIPVIFYNSSCLALVNFNLFNIHEQETEHSETSVLSLNQPCLQPGLPRAADPFQCASSQRACGDVPGLLLELQVRGLGHLGFHVTPSVPSAGFGEERA